MTGSTAETFGGMNIGLEIFRWFGEVLNAQGKMTGCAAIGLPLGFAGLSAAEH
jgi:hypothetical protein